MASLRDLQAGFGSALLGGNAAAIARCIVANGIDPERRVGIYVHNTRENFLATLEATYPVLLRLAGRDWLRQAGDRYRLHHPSRHGNLHYIGESFAAWLLAELGEGPYAYFVDVARLEWAYQEVLVSAEPGTLDCAALAAVPEALQGGILLELAPAARLVESVYPLLAIWRANRAEVVEPPTVRLDAGGSRLLLVRRADHVELRELPAADFALLQSIARRQPLAVALENALGADPDCNVAAILPRCVQAGALSGFHLTNP